MRLKSYFAASVAEAIEKARVELGPEAMLLNSREIAPEQRHLGAYEVVFGLTGEPLIPRRSEVITQLFTPPAVTIASKEAEMILESSAAAVTPSPVTAANAIPAWKRTLEELVSRQGTPVTLGSLLQNAAVSSQSVVQPAPVPDESVASVFRRETPARLQPKVVPSAQLASATPKTAMADVSTQSRSASAAVESSPVKSQAELTADLVNLQQQIERVKDSLFVSQLESARNTPSREFLALQRQLLAFGLSADFTQELLDAIGERATGAGRSVSLEQLQGNLIAELHTRVQINAEIGSSGSASKIMMLVGPPGAGKTTTLVKLAIKYGLQRRLPVHLLSLDTVRVGGSEQLATFARILNVGFDALHTTASLAEALGDRRTDEMVLIDCPGYGPADMEDAAATAAFLRRQPDIDVQLVLPAFMNTPSLQTAVGRFSIFGPSKLLFTHLDEVDSLGPILERAIKSELPVSFLTDGQGIPQDLQEAAKDRFTQSILHGAAAIGAA